MPNAYYAANNNATCTPGLGVSGVYCLLCADYYYFDATEERCNQCGTEVGRVVLFFGLLVLAIIGAIATLRSQRVRKGCGAALHQLAFAAQRLSLQTKAKICISYYQIVTQLDRVYAVVYPPSYRKLVQELGSVFQIFFGWIPGVTTACTGLGLSHELLLLAFVPLIIVLVAVLVVACRDRPLTSALPFGLVTSFLCFPFVASRGFRALAPCDCFAYVDGTPAACFLHGAYEVQCEQTAGGATVPPAGVRMAAWLAILLYAGVVPLGYAALLFAARHSLRGAAPESPLSRALLFLTKDYEPRVFWWEMVEVVRKITITGFLALVEPGTLLQLYLGSVVALCILILQMYAAPYRTLSDNFLSVASAAALVLTMLGSLGIQMTNLDPMLSDLGRGYTGMGSASVDLITVVLICAALLVLLMALGMFVQSLAIARSMPLARLLSDGMLAVPRLLPRHPPQYHAFMSHQWGSGQDQARSIKSQLTALIPGLRVFLDVDDLGDISQLESLVDASDVVIVFLSGSVVSSDERSDYMRSANCVRELRRAVEQQKRLVFVRETDPQHGAVSMETHMRDCPEDLRHALEMGWPVVPWYRVQAYAQVSLRQIAQVVLDAELRIPGEVLHAPLRVAPMERGFHLYAPTESTELAEMLQQEARDLQVAFRQEQLQIGGPAHYFLLHLHANTPWEGGLQEEVEAAVHSGIALLLVHEQREGPGAVPFATVIERTPPRLRDIYKGSLALPLYSGEEHQRVSLRVMLGKFEAEQTSRWDTWWRIPRRVQVKDEAPESLEMSLRSTKM